MFLENSTKLATLFWQLGITSTSYKFSATARINKVQCSAKHPALLVKDVRELAFTCV
jgi:hypothetical protein